MLRRVAVSGLACVIWLGALDQEADAGSFRDIQFREIDFETKVVELHNFGDMTQSLNGWRFCTHDENQNFQYSGIGGLNGVSIDVGESLFVHFNNDAPASPDAINIATIGGSFAGPFDAAPGAFSMGLYRNSNFANGADIADHIQWSLNGIDNIIADERSDEAQTGGVWQNQSTWIATSAITTRIVLLDDTGGVLHSPADYVVVGALGDMDDSGAVNTSDVAPFIQALVDPAQFSIDHPTVVADLVGDVNRDGQFDLGDIALFSGLFGGPASASAQAVPEPTTLSLAVVLLMGIAIRQRRRGYGMGAGRGGIMTFIPIEGTIAPAATRSFEGGEYRFSEADGPVPGTYNVSIRLEASSARPSRPGARQRRNPADVGRTGYEEAKTATATVPEDGPFEIDLDPE